MRTKLGWNRLRPSIAVLALVSSLSMLAVACGSDDNDKSSTTSGGAAASTTAKPAAAASSRSSRSTRAPAGSGSSADAVVGRSRCGRQIADPGRVVQQSVERGDRRHGALYRTNDRR